MAEKTLKTRILVKYDTFANWTEKNPILKAGELAVATIATGETQTVGSVDTPQVLIKVGDGTNHYNDLKFASGLAADVYSWAKAATKPAYSANEITGLDTYISGQIQDTDTQYQIVKDGDSGYKYKLQSKAKDATAWTDVAGSTIEIADPTADINSLKSLVGDTAVATQITNAIAALKLSETYATNEALEKVKRTAEDAYTDVQMALGKADDALSEASSALSDAKAYTDQKIGALPAQAKYEIKKLETATEGYLASYQLEKDGVKAGAVIDIPKDYLVKSATCETCAKADTPIAGLKVGDKYLDFVINTKDSTVATGDHVYVNVADLVDTYTAGDNIKIENNSISLASKISWVYSVPDDGAYELTEFEQNSLKMEKDLSGATKTIITPGNVCISFNGDYSASLQDLPNKVDKVDGRGLIDEGFAKKATSSASGEPVIDGNLTVVTGLTVKDGSISTDHGDIRATVAGDGELVDHYLSKKANTADLSPVAISGKVTDLVQEDGDVIIFDCGNATI